MIGHTLIDQGCCFQGDGLTGLWLGTFWVTVVHLRIHPWFLSILSRYLDLWVCGKGFLSFSWTPGLTEVLCRRVVLMSGLLGSITPWILPLRTVRKADGTPVFFREQVLPACYGKQLCVFGKKCIRNWESDWYFCLAVWFWESLWINLGFSSFLKGGIKLDSLQGGLSSSKADILLKST